MRCVDVLLPLHVEKLFSYNLPPEIKEDITPGCRVLVPLGKSKEYVGIVLGVSEKEDLSSLKDVIAVLDETPFISEKSLALWKWIASYYMCFLGDVFRIALPAGLQWEKRIPFAPVTTRFIQCINPDYPKKLTQKQAHLVSVLHDILKKKDSINGVEKHVLIEQAGVSESVLASLLRKGILKVFEKSVIPSLKFISNAHKELPPLTIKQEEIYKQAKEAITSLKTVLLKGVPLSGKTEVCAHLIQDVLNKEKQVLFLVPDIKSSSFVVKRFERYFGDKMIVYHSKISQRKRLDLWRYLSHDEKKALLIVGIRSALFLPLSNLGLIVVAEEHDESYKQNDSTPRYHARNVALLLGRLSGCSVVLSSATPSVESYYHTLTGKYVGLDLPCRFENKKLPEIHITDTVDLRRKKLQKGLFSPLLLTLIERASSLKEQILIFQNRRHYAHSFECKDCGWVATCELCGVSLVYAKHKNALICPYCGKHYSKLENCPSCKGMLIPRGIGTERIEEELRTIFPTLRIARVDSDSIENETAFFSIVEAFDKGEIDLIIGTQLIAKNIDFKRVRVVGVIDSDLLLNIPDFRAHEKTFQLLMQLAALAGRDGEGGDVVIQTRQAKLPLMHALQNYDYAKMFAIQYAERELFCYPPFTRLIRICISAADKVLLQRIVRCYEHLLILKLRDRVYGPTELNEMKYRTYIQTFLIKIESSASYISVRSVFEELYREAVLQIPGFKRVAIWYDVDPVTMN